MKRLSEIVLMLLVALFTLAWSGSMLAGVSEYRQGWEEDMGHGIQARDGSCEELFGVVLTAEEPLGPEGQFQPANYPNDSGDRDQLRDGSCVE